MDKPCSTQNRDTSKGHDDRDTTISWSASRFLEELEDDARADRRDDLRCCDGHVVYAKNDAGLIRHLLIPFHF